MEAAKNIENIEELVDIHIEKINRDRRKIVERRIVEELVMLKEIILLYGPPGPMNPFGKK